jgi:CheY-like chemotaxis protein
MPLTVLWLEDEPGTLTYEQQCVKNEADELIPAEDAETALTLVNQRIFHLIVLDLILPKTAQDRADFHANEEAGLWFIENVRNPKRVGTTARDVSMLVVTAVVRDETRRRVLAYLHAPDDYFLKPLCRNPVDFEERIRHICNQLRSTTSIDTASPTTACK